MFTVATVKAVAYLNLFSMKRWAAWLITFASLCKLGLVFYFNAPLRPMVLDAIVLFNVWAYYHRMK
jgi:hypothetical protein